MDTSNALALVIIALIGAIPPTIVALAGWRQAQHATAKVIEATKLVAENTALTEEVKEQTNGHLSKLGAELKAANAQIVALHKMVEQLTAEASKT